MVFVDDILVVLTFFAPAVGNRLMSMMTDILTLAGSQFAMTVDTCGAAIFRISRRIARRISCRR